MDNPNQNAKQNNDDTCEPRRYANPPPEKRYIRDLLFFAVFLLHPCLLLGFVSVKIKETNPWFQFSSNIAFL